MALPLTDNREGTEFKVKLLQPGTMNDKSVKNNPFQQTKPSGTFFPQELNTRLIATGILNFKSPNTFPLIAVHRHNAASRSANPSRTAQQSTLGFVPITSCTIPSQSPQTPNLRVSLGHFSGVGGNGAGFGVGGGQGAGFGVGGGTGTGFGGHGPLVDETQVKNAILSRISAPIGFILAISLSFRSLAQEIVCTRVMHMGVIYRRFSKILAIDLI